MKMERLTFIVCFVILPLLMNAQTFEEYKKSEKEKYDKYVENDKKMFEAFVNNELDWNKAILGYEVKTPISEKIDKSQSKNVEPKLNIPAYVDNTASLDKEISLITARVEAAIAHSSANAKKETQKALKAEAEEQARKEAQAKKEAEAKKVAESKKEAEKPKDVTPKEQKAPPVQTAPKAAENPSKNEENQLASVPANNIPVTNEYKESLIEQEKQSIPSMVPLDAGYRISSQFGNRFHPKLFRWRFHGGVDLASPSGTAIHTTASGTVIKSGSNGNYGNYVLIEHGNGFRTAYGHLSSIEVKEGTKVTRGQEIGKVGSTGLSTGPHLHYEVIKNSKRVNPEYFFGS